MAYVKWLYSYIVFVNKNTVFCASVSNRIKFDIHEIYSLNALKEKQFI